LPDIDAPETAKKEMDVAGGERDAPTEGAGPDREFTVESRSQSQMVLRRFLHHRLAMVCLVVLIIVVLFSLLGGRLWTYSYDDITDSFNTPPFRALDENGELVWSAEHPMGTDTEGHDFMALILRGAQKSVQIMLLVAFLSTAIGIVYGAVSGYYSGRIDGLMMRILDVLFTIPLLAILIVLSRRIESSGSWLFVALLLGFFVWFTLARLVRAEFLSLREKEFVEAARALGAGDARIIFRHILPNTVGTIIVSATLTMATAILLETALSYLGLGIRAPDTSLGLLVSRYEAASTTRPWLFYIPGVFIVIIALCVNFVGDGLRDAFDPKQTRVRQ
jgi:peptide/nickel transport system permease protein